MSRRPRALIGFVIGMLLVVVLLALTGGYWYLFARSFPQTTGTIRVAGLQAPVKVFRDRWGVPHIYAEGMHDLFFAQGYVTAQDRLWQMEFLRRAGSGTLSEVLGPGALAADRFVRTLGWRRIAEAEVPLLDQESRGILEAYSQGVTAFIEGHRGQLPLEFTILGYEPDPWSPADSLAFAKLMAWTLGEVWQSELMRARFIQALGEEQAWAIAPVNPGTGRSIVEGHAPSLANLDLDGTIAWASALGRVTGLEGLSAGDPGQIGRAHV